MLTLLLTFSNMCVIGFILYLTLKDSKRIDNLEKNLKFTQVNADAVCAERARNSQQYVLSELDRRFEKETKNEICPKRPYKKHKWLTALEGSRLLKLPKTTFIRWSNQGYVPYKKIGKAFLYREEDLLKLNIEEIREKNMIEQAFGHSHVTTEIKKNLYDALRKKSNNKK